MIVLVLRKTRSQDGRTERIENDGGGQVLDHWWETDIDQGKKPEI